MKDPQQDGIYILDIVDIGLAYRQAGPCFCEDDEKNMSKHSKWAKVKNYKGVADSKRAGVFTKLGRAITVACKQGGADASMNFRLRLAIEKAREANMPKDTIDRAILRATGDTEGTVIEEVVYEGFGPGGAAIVVHALTDNKNRTLMNVRNHIARHGGTMAGQHAVAWMFERRGVIRVARTGASLDDEMLTLIDLGAQDVVHEDEALTVSVASDSVEEMKKKFEAAGMKVEFAEAILVPKEKVQIEDVVRRTQLEKIIELLEEDEDVDDVVTNAEL